MTRTRIVAVIAATAATAVLAACATGPATTGAAPATSAAHLTTCPSAPAGPPPGAGAPGALPGIQVAKTIAPSDTSTSVLINPTGPQIQCGRTQLSTYDNVVYSTPTSAGKQVPLVMDIQVPKTPGSHPLVVFIPGGGFEVAIPNGNLAQTTYVAEQGYAVASVSYRTILQGGTYRDGVTDVKSAIRYLRANAGKYGIDAAKVAVWGQSAGGYLSAMVGVTNNDKQFDVGANLDQSSAVQGVVDQFGLSDLTKVGADFDPAEQAFYASPTGIVATYVLGAGNTRTLAQQPGAAAAADPLTYVTSSAPPFALFHGSADHVVSPSQTLLMRSALRAKGVEATRYVVEGADHGGLSTIEGPTPAHQKSDAMWSTQTVMNLVTGFLRTHLGS